MLGRRPPKTSRSEDHKNNIVAPGGDLSAAGVVLAGPSRAPLPPVVFNKHRSTSTGWYNEAWGMYDEVGEHHFAVNWIGNIISRARLYAAHRGPDGLWRPSPGRPAELVEQLTHADAGESAMLSRFGILLTVTGDSYLLGIPQPDGEDLFAVAAPGELSIIGGQRKRGGVRAMYNQERLPDSTAIIRVWRPHPANRYASDSPTRAALPILSEIANLTRHVSAQINSRLAGPGLLLLPNEMNFPLDEDGKPSAQLFVNKLEQTMSAAVQDTSSPSSLVPIIVTGAGEHLKEAAQMQFWTNLDENSVELRTEAIRRLALSMDMPPEILTGMGDSNHWNTYAIDDAAIKVHAIPPLELIVSTLTVGYLRPLLRLENYSGADKHVILADTSQMRTRPNRSREAIELFDRAQISAEAVVREVGFAPEDAMTDEQRKMWLLMRVASGSATPEQVSSALTQLGVDVGDADAGDVSRESRPHPSLDQHPRGGDPDPRTLDRALTASANPYSPVLCSLDLAEPLVLRALEKCGNRIRNFSGSRKASVAPEVHASDVYLHVSPYPTSVGDLLAGAWTAVPRLAADRGLNAAHIIEALDIYTRELLTDRAPHSQGRLAQFLKENGRS